MIEQIKELFTIDYAGFFIIICTIIAGLKAVSALFEWFIEKTGLELRFFRKQKEQYELLTKTAKNLDLLQNNVKLLQEKHNNDVNESINHDKRIEENLNIFMSDVKKTVSEIQNNVVEIQNNMNKYSENRINDREISRKIQNDWIDIQEKNTEKIDSIINKIDKMKEDTDQRFTNSEERIRVNEEKEKKRHISELKDRISQSYRYHAKRGEITNVDFETLRDLIDAYSEFNKNSFVHSVVEKQMYEWRRIDDGYDPH